MSTEQPEQIEVYVVLQLGNKRPGEIEVELPESSDVFDLRSAIAKHERIDDIHAKEFQIYVTDKSKYRTFLNTTTRIVPSDHNLELLRGANKVTANCYYNSRVTKILTWHSLCSASVTALGLYLSHPLKSSRSFPLFLVILCFSGMSLELRHSSLLIVQSNRFQSNRSKEVVKSCWSHLAKVDYSFACRSIE